MSDYAPSDEELKIAYRHHSRLVDDERYRSGGLDVVTDDEYDAQFARALAEVRRQAAEEALTAMADELAALDDGGKRGLQGHSKSSASAITHRHAVDVVRARAQAYRAHVDGKTHE